MAAGGVPSPLIKQIDNGATERANRDVAIGRGNWTFFGSDAGGRTAAILMSFIATCKRCGVEPFAWFRDVLSRIATHPMHRLPGLLPPNRQTFDTPAHPQHQPGGNASRLRSRFPHPESLRIREQVEALEEAMPDRPGVVVSFCRTIV